MKQIYIILLLTVFMSMVGANSYSFVVKNSDGAYIWYSRINDNTVAVSQSNGADSYGSTSNKTAYVGNVTIPESVTYEGKNYTVTSIQNYAFCYCSSLKSVTIPNSVTTIGSSAFQGCSGLTSITFSNSIKSIGRYAFMGCSNIDNLILPNSLINIEKYAFYDCRSLGSITIPNSVTTIGEETFANTEWYNKQPEGLIYAGNVAYKYKGEMPPDTRIELRDGTVGIGSKAFEGCINLSSIIIPSTLINISSDAFSGCTRLTKVILNCNEIVSKSYISDYSLSYILGKQVKEYIIGNEVTSIGQCAFYNTYAKSVTIGTGVLSIGNGAFGFSSRDGIAQGAQPVKVIWLTNTPPSGYKNAEGEVNYVANDLYTSLVNKTVYPFLSSMFEVGGIKYVPVSPSERTCDAIDSEYNSKAENVNIGNTVSYKGVEMKLNTVKDYVCIGNPHIKDVKLTYSSNVPYQAFSWCTGIQTATITNDGNIGSHAFNGCSALQTATISNNGNIGESAFSGCTALQTAIISNNGYIGTRAFNNSMQGQPATIEVSNKGYIGNFAFNGCTALQTATISNNGYIGTSAFEGSMTKSPATVYLYNKGNINEKAFYGCTKLQNATLGDEIPSIGNSAFYNCSSLQSIVIPDVTTSLGTEVFNGCSSMMSANVGSGLTIIPYKTFSGCLSLNNMQIGQNVKTIDTYAFQNCSSLQTIEIPKSVTAINDNVFKGCSSLTKVTMNDREDYTELALGSNSSSPIFSDCPLDEVYIGRNISYSTLSSKGYSPFYRNTSLRSVTITDRETEISPNEFYGCTNLKEVSIGNRVKTIGNWAFSGCSSLDFFSFGSAVETIGQEAFSDCTAMTKLISKAATPPTCGTQALDDINKWTCILQVPEKSLSLYEGAEQWKEFFFKEGVDMGDVEPLEDEITVMISSAGYATFYNSSSAYKLPSGLYAQVIESTSNSELSYKTIAKGESDGIIPQGVSVLLVSNDKKGGAYTLTSTTESSSYTGSNLLYGSDEQTMTSNVNGVSTSGNSNYVYYKLTYGKSGSANANKLGWYWGATNGAAFSIDGGKAWLAIPKTSAQSMNFMLPIDEETGIENVEQNEAQKVDGILVNTAGQRVGENYRGMIIRNGKKIMK